MLAPVRTVAPTNPLLTTAEVKAHLRVDTSDDDALIDAIRDAVTDHLDGWSGILGRCLLSQTWRQDFPDFGTLDRIRLPLMPAKSITSITYRDGLNAVQTLSTSIYSGPFVDGLSPFVSLVSGQVWPSTYEREDAVSITFVAGYDTAADVPKSIRQAALLMIGDLYEHRETVAIGTISSSIPASPNVDALLSKYRRITP